MMQVGTDDLSLVGPEGLRYIHDSLSPLDYRYWSQTAADYLSEHAFTRYKLQVEVALAEALAKLGLCGQGIPGRIAEAVDHVTTADIYEREEKNRHDIRSMVQAVQWQLEDDAKPVVHLLATSYDVVNTADAARFRDCTRLALAPSVLQLLETLATIAKREAGTLQAGRTHGQHAVPITFGFAIAGFVSRLGNSLTNLLSRAEQLSGKFSGPVGAFNAADLFLDDPRELESLVMTKMGVPAAEIATQIVPQEAMVRFLDELVTIAGIMADLANDMRQLQRTEIGEVGEEFLEQQVGSSTMPQKRNPIRFENVISLWKIVVSRITLWHLDQLSEHQRDLTNSASGRTYGEVIAYVLAMVKTLNAVMAKLQVNPEAMSRNLGITGSLIVAEPCQLILAAHGHPDSHEAIRKMTLAIQRGEHEGLLEAMRQDPEIAGYLGRFTPGQMRVLEDPKTYIGRAEKQAVQVALNWSRRVAAIRSQLDI